MKQKLTKLEKYWVLYDVGNSAFTLLVSTIIPIYFKNMAHNMGVSASDSTAYLSYAISISTIIVAILGPILGAVADNKNHKKPLFTFFMMIGVLGCAALSIPKTWLMFLIIFVIAKVGFSGSLIFYDSMMVDVTTDERMDEVSSHGYAWGYIGSCVPFVISLLLVLGGDKVGISTPAAMTAAFFLNAAWWGLVTIPLLKNYEQKYYVENQGSMVKESFARLGRSVAELKDNKKVALFLLADYFKSCFYPGIGSTVSLVIDIPQTHIVDIHVSFSGNAAARFKRRFVRKTALSGSIFRSLSYQTEKICGNFCEPLRIFSSVHPKHWC